MDGSRCPGATSSAPGRCPVSRPHDGQGARVAEPPRRSARAQGGASSGPRRRDRPRKPHCRRARPGASPPAAAARDPALPGPQLQPVRAQVVRAGLGYRALDSRPPGVGRDQLELLEIHRRGDLPQHYADRTPSDEEIDGPRQGRFIVDRRVQESLSGDADGDGRVRPTPADVATMDLVRPGAGRARLRGRHGRGAPGGAPADRRDADEPRGIRNSRLVRATRPARRLYYRVRGE